MRSRSRLVNRLATRHGAPQTNRDRLAIRRKIENLSRPDAANSAAASSLVTQDQVRGRGSRVLVSRTTKHRYFGKFEQVGAGVEVLTIMSRAS